jgi:hypothetical protein
MTTASTHLRYYPAALFLDQKVSTPLYFVATSQPTQFWDSVRLSFRHEKKCYFFWCHYWFTKKSITYKIVHVLLFIKIFTTSHPWQRRFHNIQHIQFGISDAIFAISWSTKKADRFLSFIGKSEGVQRNVWFTMLKFISLFVALVVLGQELYRINLVNNSEVHCVPWVVQGQEAAQSSSFCTPSVHSLL